MAMQETAGCLHEWRMKVELLLDIPIRLHRRLNKKRLRVKDVRIDGANWEKALIYCTKCGEYMKGGTSCL